MIHTIENGIKEIQNDLIKLSEYILEHPELGYQEEKACKAHVDLLKKHHFVVKENYMDIKTAFRAEFDSQKPGPTIAYLSEYDALPNIGHGCGHNLLGTTSTGAGILLSKCIHKTGGKVVILGTPAEETSGAKVKMSNEKAFDDIDVALVAHPADFYYESGESLALEALKFTFTGKSSHAAASPEKGINALDACIGTFNHINALREHIRSDARIHGIIKEGGVAANVVPDLAIAQFYVRATTKTYLKELVEKVKNCAKGASLATGTDLSITNYELSYDNLVTNQTLSKAFNKRLKDMGVDTIYPAKESYGSLDAGNVSHVCPTIHPYFGICHEETAAHTKAFRDATQTPFAYENMNKTIGALVLTGIDVIKDPSLLDEIRKEFKNCVK